MKREDCPPAGTLVQDTRVPGELHTVIEPRERGAFVQSVEQATDGGHYTGIIPWEFLTTDTSPPFKRLARYTVELHGAAWEHAQTMAVLAAWRACRKADLPLSPQQCDVITLAAFRSIRGQVERRAKDQAEAAACTCDPAPHREDDGSYSHWAGCPVADAQQAADTPSVLSASERGMLKFALDTAQEKIWVEGGFTEEDQAALDSLRRLQGDAR
jgi:hypothetical protein